VVAAAVESGKTLEGARASEKAKNAAAYHHADALDKSGRPSAETRAKFREEMTRTAKEHVAGQDRAALKEAHASSYAKMPTDRERFENPKTSADWAYRMAKLRDVQPRPLNKMYGKNPTPDQIASHKEATKAWDRQYRKASKEQKRLGDEENRAFHEKQRHAVDNVMKASDPDRLYTTQEIADKAGISSMQASDRLLALSDAGHISRFAPSGDHPARYSMTDFDRRTKPIPEPVKAATTTKPTAKPKTSKAAASAPAKPKPTTISGMQESVMRSVFAGNTAAAQRKNAALERRTRAQDFGRQMMSS
jgi:ribosomal protein S25